MYYGVYDNMSVGGQSTTTNASIASSHKREASSASSIKRKDPRRLQMDTSNGFSSSAASSMIKNCVDKKARKQIVKEAEMEFKLRGKFKRVFPSIDYHYYKQFFTEERTFNIILDEKLMAKRRLGNNLQPSLLITSGQVGLHMPIIAHNQLPNILPPLPQQIHLKSKIDSLKGKSQLVEAPSSKLSNHSLAKRSGGASSQSAANITNQ